MIRLAFSLKKQTFSFKNIAASLALIIAAVPLTAQAQFSDSYTFLQAVRDANASKVLEFINKPGTTIVNTRDVSTGETPLHIVTNRRDLSWMNFFLSRGANANAEDSHGLTPLMIATQLHFAEGITLLLNNGASVDKAGSSGETPLIRAVQLRDSSIVRLLISKGANPDKQDLTGLSARDYAKRDSRGSAMLDDLSSAKATQAPSGPVQGPKF